MDLVIIDARGMECPKPITEVMSRVAQLPPGTEFEVLVDNDVCFYMIRRLLMLNDVQIIETDEERFRLRCRR